MAKRKPPLHQPSLFRRDVPQMPEGYYSSGPNPNLRRFVEEHAKPFDPTTDDYNVPPFDKPITTTKATAIYNMHTYWSKKPHDAIREYIKHYTKPGDLVLDPFCGSGGTALAALIEGRAAIAIDLSPAATFITKNYCTPADLDELHYSIEELERILKPEINWLYETRCDRCDGLAITSYTVYSYVFQCPRCLERIPLFDCIDAIKLITSGQPRPIRACPRCHSVGIIEEISTRSSQRYEQLPVMVGYYCVEGCKPKIDERRHNDKNDKKKEYFNLYDLHKIQEIESKLIPYSFPTKRMMNAPANQNDWGVLWRPYHGDIVRVDQFFTKRNLWALAALRNGVLSLRNERIRDVALFAFSGILLGMSKMNQYRPDVSFPTSILKGTYYIPQISKEEQPLKHLLNKLIRLGKGYEEINEQISSMNFLIDTESSIYLPSILSNSIDFIFTDPPYAGSTQYGELNFIWEAWLNFDSKWLDEEIIINENRGITEHDWMRLLSTSMSECFRMLKPGRWVSLCYHDTSEGTWQLVQDMMTEIGFIPEKSESTLFIDTGGTTYNQMMGDKVTKRDLVINFRKPRPDELASAAILIGNEDATTFAEKARMILCEALEAHPGSVADRLYDELVSRMVRRGEFERHNFDEILRSVAEEVNGRWYLLETAGQVDEAESKKEAAAAKYLEGTMQKALSEQRDAMGVHYSDLFEQYLPITDKPRRLLQDWLPEFFFKNTDGTWRPPINEEERQQKAALRSSGALRRIKRFANALLDGVPPADRDKPENAVTLADWIRQCRRAGLFELGRVLYEKGGLRFDELTEETQLLVEEDYQICVGRSKKAANSERGIAKKKAAQPRLIQEDEA